MLGDIAGLEKPIIKIIESISHSIASLYEPTAIVRRAKAEGKALILNTIADEKSKAIRERAIQSRELELIRHQRNREDIIKIALDLCPNEANDETPDPDWIAEFFDFSKNCSNSNMQILWGKLLGGEICHPCSFSRRALHTVRIIDFNEADLFTNACSYLWDMHNSDGTKNYIILSAPEDKNNIQGSFPLDFGSLRKLEFLGLFATERLVLYEGEALEISYGEEKAIIYGASEIDFIALTPLGEELCPVSGFQRDFEYKEFFFSWLKDSGLKFERVG